MSTLGERLQHAWNAFRGRDHPDYRDLGPTSYYRPDRRRTFNGDDRSIVEAICNRMAIDVAAVPIIHARVDQNGRYIEEINDGLHNCLNVAANIDQTGRAFRQDIAQSMFDEGVVAVCPIDTNVNPAVSASYDIETMRVGRITQWSPRHVRVELYNDRTGMKEEVNFSKEKVAVIENPLFDIMNKPNSTLNRLRHKLTLLDRIDEQSSSGKLDLIIQLPYVVKSEMRQKQADERRKKIEEQLNGSKYGIAYIDGTEKVTQLNRAIENNLLNQIEYLTNQLYAQLGITPEILNGTADEKAMLNYNNRTIEPILAAIADEFKRKFLTKTARTQGQSVLFIQDPFKLVPVSNIADIADKFTRNEILSSNELRGIVGFKPVDDERADELRNKNLNQSGEELNPVTASSADYQNGSELAGDKRPGEPQPMQQPQEPQQESASDNIAKMPISEFMALMKKQRPAK